MFSDLPNEVRNYFGRTKNNPLYCSKLLITKQNFFTEGEIMRLPVCVSQTATPIISSRFKNSSSWGVSSSLDKPVKSLLPQPQTSQKTTFLKGKFLFADMISWKKQIQTLPNLVKKWLLFVLQQEGPNNCPGFCKNRKALPFSSMRAQFRGARCRQRQRYRLKWDKIY